MSTTPRTYPFTVHVGEATGRATTRRNAERKVGRLAADAPDGTPVAILHDGQLVCEGIVAGLGWTYDPALIARYAR